MRGFEGPTGTTVATIGVTGAAVAFNDSTIGVTVGIGRIVGIYMTCAEVAHDTPIMGRALHAFGGKSWSTHHLGQLPDSFIPALQVQSEKLF